MDLAYTDPNSEPSHLGEKYFALRPQIHKQKGSFQISNIIFPRSLYDLKINLLRGERRQGGYLKEARARKHDTILHIIQIPKNLLLIGQADYSTESSHRGDYVNHIFVFSFLLQHSFSMSVSLVGKTKSRSHCCFLAVHILHVHKISLISGNCSISRPTPYIYLYLPTTHQCRAEKSMCPASLFS